jgi:hypothetical protein
MSNWRQPNTLYINRSDSVCGSCGRGCDPYELKHDTILEYSGGGEGCHAPYKYLASDYAGMQDACQDMRPDLEWVGGVYDQAIARAKAME